jgi:hypothetical protein
VEFGLGEGKLDFYVVVFSLINIVIFQVLVENDVTIIKCTETIGLSTSLEKFNEDVDPLEACCRRQALSL